MDEDNWDDGEGGVGAFFQILWGLTYLFIVIPLAWLAEKIGLLDD